MEKTAPLLRQDQVVEMEADKVSAEKKLASQTFQGDRAEVAAQLRALNHQLESQRPRTYEGAELDAAVRRERELRDQFTQGMLSQEEMRKNPPGATGRLIEWEKKNLHIVEEWQNIRRRLNVGSDDPEIASIERYRPTVSTMNMDNAQIAGKLIFLPSADAGNPVTFNTEQLALLRQLSPEIADKLCTLSNPQRAQVKETLTGGIGLATEKKPYNQMNKAERAVYKATKAA